MADVKWIKIVTDIFDDEKVLLIETLPEADSIIVIWFKLLCLAGKQNNSGVFVLNDKMPYDEKMFATIFRRKEMTVRLALQTFEQFGMIEMIDNVVTIPNWGKHQNFDKIEANNEYMRKYMAEYREKQKLLGCKVNSKTNGKVNVKPLEENREEKSKKDSKEIYGTFNNVKLTAKEYESLIKDYGQGSANKAIGFLSAYREEKGYKNKSDYLSLKRWVFDAIDKNTKSPKTDILSEIIKEGMKSESNRNSQNNETDPIAIPRLLQE